MACYVPFGVPSSLCTLFSTSHHIMQFVTKDLSKKVDGLAMSYLFDFRSTPI